MKSPIEKLILIAASDDEDAAREALKAVYDVDPKLLERCGKRGKEFLRCKKLIADLEKFEMKEKAVTK